MSLTVGPLITSAEGMAYPYVTARSTLPGPLLRTLATLDAEVTGMIASVAPHLVTVPCTTPIPIVFASNPTGYALEAAKSWKDFRLVDANGQIYPVRISPHLDFAQKHPAVYVESGKVYPVDSMSRRFADSSVYRKFWVTGDTLHYRKVQADSVPSSLTSTLLSPEYAAQYMIWTLAYMLLLNYHGIEGIVPPEKLNALATGVAALKQGLWQSIANAAAVASSIHSVDEV